MPSSACPHACSTPSRASSRRHTHRLGRWPRPGRHAGDHHSPAVVTAPRRHWPPRTAAANATAETLRPTSPPATLQPTRSRSRWGSTPAVRDAWSRADMPHQTAVLAALAELGKPYRYATSDPDRGFDCSGLTAYAWARAASASPTRVRHRSVRLRRATGNGQAGDIVQYPGHVCSISASATRSSTPRTAATTSSSMSRAQRALRQPDPLSGFGPPQHRRSISTIRVVRRLNHVARRTSATAFSERVARRHSRPVGPIS